MLVLSREPGLTVDEERVVLATDDGKVAARGLWFEARSAAGLLPWADLTVEDRNILADLAERLGPGTSIMVAYERDETEHALRRGAHPGATPLGLALLRAGCRWFKDWFFPEGGREGGTKLQGTIPLDQDNEREATQQLVRELRDFLRHEDVHEEDRHRAREALSALEEGLPRGESG